MELFKTNLSMFDGEGGTDGSIGASSTPGSESAADGSTPESEVKPTAEERQKAYDEFKKANKDLFTADFQKQFDKRFKNAKSNEEALKKHQELAELLYSKYHVQDIDALKEAMDQDDSLVAELADEQGMTPEQYKRFHALEKQNKELLAQEQRRQADAEMGAKITQWRAEEKALKDLYPNFSLDEEYNNETFRRVLNSGVSVQNAYQMVHFNELMSMNAQATQKAVADNIRAKGSRPAENGTKNASGFTSKKSISNLTNEEMDELIARSRRGETIIL